MKKIISMLLFACITLGISAQEPGEHLKFKGIPIDGTVNEFVAKLKQKGCTYFDSYNGSILLTGDFATEKNCTIMVAAPKANCPLERVVVMCPSKESWTFLYNNYKELKDMLISKYGEPASCEETFQGYSQPEDDSMKMLKVQMDQCRYVSGFNTGNGYIELAIMKSGYSNCFVRILYVDAANRNAAESKAMDDI